MPGILIQVVDVKPRPCHIFEKKVVYLIKFSQSPTRNVDHQYFYLSPSAFLHK